MKEPSPQSVALRGLCPRCANKTLFAGVATFAPKCRACGLDYRRLQCRRRAGRLPDPDRRRSDRRPRHRARARRRAAFLGPRPALAAARRRSRSSSRCAWPRPPCSRSNTGTARAKAGSGPSHEADPARPDPARRRRRRAHDRARRLAARSAPTRRKGCSPNMRLTAACPAVDLDPLARRARRGRPDRRSSSGACASPARRQTSPAEVRAGRNRATELGGYALYRRLPTGRPRAWRGGCGSMSAGRDSPDAVAAPVAERRIVAGMIGAVAATQPIVLTAERPRRPLEPSAAPRIEDIPNNHLLLRLPVVLLRRRRGCHLCARAAPPIAGARPKPLDRVGHDAAHHPSQRPSRRQPRHAGRRDGGGRRSMPRPARATSRRRLNGIAHLFEHMVFKGAGGRSAREISEAIEDVGGDLNACHRPRFDQLHRLGAGRACPARGRADRRPAPPAPFHRGRAGAREGRRPAGARRGARHAQRHHLRRSPGGRLRRPAARPAGARQRGEHRRRSPSSDLHGWRSGQYRAGSLSLVAAGKVEHDRLVELAEAHVRRPPDGGTVPAPEPAHFTGGNRVGRSHGDQAHLALGFVGARPARPADYAARLFADIVGGGMSSRLFQQLREERGLAYSVYSPLQPWRDGGLFQRLCRHRAAPVGRRRRS